MLTVEEVKTWQSYAQFYCGIDEAYEVLEKHGDPNECAVLWYKLEKDTEGRKEPAERTYKVVYQTDGKGTRELASRWAMNAAEKKGVGNQRYRRKGHNADDDLMDELSPSGQGYMGQAAHKRAVELCAVAAAEAYYCKLGYKVENTSATQPYDLRCHKEKQEVRVEVKGSSGDGAEVFLTAGEVQNARESGVRTDLFVWGFIEINHDETDARGIGGRLVFHRERWNPSDVDLCATQYRYRIPN